MIVLIALVTFFTSANREPFGVILPAPSMAACQAKVVEQSAKAEKDPEVSGYTFRCITVPTKS